MNDVEAIRQQGEGLIQAFNGADPDAAALFLTEDFFGMPPNQPSVLGREAARSWWTEGFRVMSSHMEVTSQDLQIVSDSAIERFSFITEARPVGGGPAAKDKGKGLWIWRRQRDGSWKLAQAIFNSDNPVTATV